MASKYGKKPYGTRLYSAAWVDFTSANLSFTVGLAGRLSYIVEFIGSFAFGIAGTSRVIVSIPFSSGLDFTTVWSGDLREYSGMCGNIAVAFVMSGDLFRAAEREFIGVPLAFSVDLQGRLGLAKRFQGFLDIPVTFGGGDNIYLGPFWDPDDPLKGPWDPGAVPPEPWTPVPPPSGPWTAVGTSAGNWTPDTPVRPGWVSGSERKWGDLNG